MATTLFKMCLFCLSHKWCVRGMGDLRKTAALTLYIYKSTSFDKHFHFALLTNLNLSTIFL